MAQPVTSKPLSTRSLPEALPVEPVNSPISPSRRPLSWLALSAGCLSGVAIGLLLGMILSESLNPRLREIEAERDRARAERNAAIADCMDRQADLTRTRTAMSAALASSSAAETENDRLRQRIDRLEEELSKPARTSTPTVPPAIPAAPAKTLPPLNSTKHYGTPDP